MASNDQAAIVEQVAATAEYDTLREVVSQLAGLLVARQRAAATPVEAQAWGQEHHALRVSLDRIQPGTPAVTEALEQVGDRLAALRRPDA